MTYPKPTIIKDPALTRRIYLVAALITVVLTLLVAALFYYKVNRAAGGVRAEARLEGALRPGAAGFEQVRERVGVETPVAMKSERALGDMVMELTTTVRNDTGRRIRGLEMRGAVVDAQGQTLRERTVVLVPEQQAALEPGEAMSARILIEGVAPEAERADVRMDITGILLEDGGV